MYTTYRLNTDELKRMTCMNQKRTAFGQHPTVSDRLNAPSGPRIKRKD